MIDVSPGIEQPGQNLIFSSGKSKPRFLGLFVIGAIFAIAMSQSTPADVGAGAILLVLMICISLQSASRRWTAEIDVTARRIRIFRRSFDRWTKTTVDCSFDECSALGTFESDNDGHPSYSVYVKLEGGTRHTIPIANATLNEASRVASQLATSTGIPRLDIYTGPIYITPDDTTSRRGS